MPKKVTRKFPAPVIQSANAPLAAGQKYVLKALVLGNDACPIEDWLGSIQDVQTKQRVQSRLDRVERGNLGDCKPVGQGIFELRMDFGAGYRIYYAVTGTTLIVLLVGGDKSTQDKDILAAQQLWKDNRDDTQRYKRTLRR